MILFQKPYQLHKSDRYIQEVLTSGHVEGDGKYTSLTSEWIQNRLTVQNVLMMNSCTSALECAMQVIGLKPGDEVILPSFTYPSTANAVVLAGASPVFGQVKKEDMTLDEHKLIDKISHKTKAIIVVHYGGVSCNMDEIMSVAKANNLVVVEDCAQSFLAKYNGEYTGTIGDFGCFSFHGTKDFVAGEGGALVVNNTDYLEQVEIFRQKGTNRTAFINGKSAFYEWVYKGSSMSPSELNMALLYGQLNMCDEILSRRKEIYSRYSNAVNGMINKHHLGHKLYASSKEAKELNGHLFYLVFSKIEEAKGFVKFMYEQGVETRTHFVPLHESRMGSRFVDDETFFEHEEAIGKRLVRLPIYPELTDDEQMYVIQRVEEFLMEKIEL